MMKKLFILLVVSLFSMGVYAQESLVGRVYQSNMMKEGLAEATKIYEKETKDVDAKEKAETDKIVKAISEAIEQTITVKFLTNTELEISIISKFDDKKAKDAGVPWAIRKIFKLKHGKNKSIKGKAHYTYDGKTVNLKPKEDKKMDSKLKKNLVLQMSANGKTLLWDLDGTRIVLPRIK